MGEPQLPKKGLKSHRSHILTTSKLHTSGGRLFRYSRDMYQRFHGAYGFVSLADFVCLFILIGKKACAWICSGSRNFGSKSLLRQASGSGNGSRPCVASMNLLVWLSRSAVYIRCCCHGW
jgi:hypothetical protein